MESGECELLCVVISTFSERIYQPLLKRTLVKLHSSAAARMRRRLEHIDQLLREDNEFYMTQMIAAGHNVLDLKCLNGKLEDTAFDDFCKCVESLLSKRDHLAAEERRRVGTDGASTSHLRPTPLAPSLPALHQQVCVMMNADERMKHDPAKGRSKIPSLAAFACMMCPSHPGRVTSSRYSSKLKIIFRMQSRSARKLHMDAHYVNVQSVLKREWACDLAGRGVDILFISDDDRCKIPVGAPGFAQASVSRQRRAIAGVLVRLLHPSAEEAFM